MKKTVVIVGLLSLMACNENTIEPENNLNSQITALPTEELSSTEEQGLLFLREEEKLARDVYSTLYKQWGVRVFDNISQSEQTHTDAVKVLINKYGLTDPVINEASGIFDNQELQQLYDQLVASGSQSIENAYAVGATIEDLDLFDLAQNLNEVDNQDITFVYENLSKGSRNHLRAFYDRITSIGKDYTPQFISEEQFNDIVTSSKETGGW
ncbi:DUF2202 domain-containing protein [Jiulongibacter sediminis]|uniref:Ferritin n=1 Tax=Jiulongibacter sediminis TaxID=1605367 RepID=A0A0P7BSJ3_9BACT|nr:DUF2202 domain-containing protein [Jiulongibacter sediminis]KPM47423.1 ferritin [Jiulongibacter sediminis]TBX23003.1 ferritin [Jiulongibacter sediminis]